MMALFNVCLAATMYKTVITRGCTSRYSNQNCLRYRRSEASASANNELLVNILPCQKYTERPQLPLAGGLVAQHSLDSV